jgi:uncharacterized protein YdeI (YjbR/CyaY-like superfamily)
MPKAQVNQNNPGNEYSVGACTLVSDTKIKAGLPIIAFASSADWEKWLSAQPRICKGLWLKLAKKESGIASVSRQEAIDGALCYGWIDGQLDKFDDSFWLVRYTPRSRKSKWSKINQVRAQELIDQKRMKPAGLDEVNAAKTDGRWQAAYAPQSKASVPDDLQTALDGNPRAKSFFSELDSANRYAILYRVQEAKKAETRAERIKKYVQMLAQGKTIHPLKARKTSAKKTTAKTRKGRNQGPSVARS